MRYTRRQLLKRAGVATALGVGGIWAKDDYDEHQRFDRIEPHEPGTYAGTLEVTEAFKYIIGGAAKVDSFLEGESDLAEDVTVTAAIYDTDEAQVEEQTVRLDAPSKGERLRVPRFRFDIGGQGLDMYDVPYYSIKADSVSDKDRK